MSKSVLITGASRGIGRATACLAGARGWAVGVNYVNDTEAATATVAEIERGGGKAIAIKGDVSIESDAIALFDAVEKAFGRVDALVNNAAIAAPTMPLADMGVERLKRMFDVNVLGAYLCAREAARRMSKSRGGRGGAIVNVSSGAAKRGSPNEYVDYAGSKGALDTLTIGLAKELGPEGVRVNGVRPGFVATDIHETIGDPTRLARYVAQTPLGRAAEPAEIAEAILWLLGDGASYATGAILDVTGGL